MNKLYIRCLCISLMTCSCLPFQFANVLAQSTDIVTSDELLITAKSRINNLDTDSFQELIASEPDLVVIDVRMPDELASLGGSIDSGRRDVVINRGWLEFRIDDVVPDKDTPIVVYCGINQRSPLAAATLMDMGYSNVSNYADGFFAWQEAGLALQPTDEAVGSMLYSMPVEVIPGVFSAIGATAPPTYENSGHNNNLTFIVTDEGVVVVNASDNALLAEALHKEIRKVTDQPVRYVVLENGQGHAMLGTDYWQAAGASVIAHEDALAEIEERGDDILKRMERRNRDKAMNTRLALPDQTFTESFDITLGGVTIELLHLGPAHSPGDIVVWLPETELVIAGDMAFHQRLLPVFEDTDTAGWLDTWQAFASLGAKTVIPGHGQPTTMAEVTRWTRDYLMYMRAEVAKILDAGGSLIDAYAIDQSAYRHLDTFDELAGLNSDRIFRAMEFE